VEDALNDRQRLLLDAAQVVAPLEALRVELVDIFGAPRDAPRTSGARRGSWKYWSILGNLRKLADFSLLLSEKW
jgi:hypothetical protein